MTLNDPLSNALSKIMNAEQSGKDQCIVKSSKIIKEVLTLLNKYNYIGEFNEIKDQKGNILQVHLLKNINKCGVIKPRYPVCKHEIEKFERRYLPAKDFGFILISTSKGLLTHIETKSKNIGGKLIAYCY